METGKSKRGVIIFIQVIVVFIFNFCNSQKPNINSKTVVLFGNDFPGNPFPCKPFKDSIEKIYNISFKIKAEAIKNSLIEQQIDTIISFQYKNSIIKTYYNVVNKTYSFLYAQVVDDSIFLKFNIEIGITKDVLISVFPEIDNLSSNVIELTDESGFSSVSLYFDQNNKLEKLEYENYE